VTTWLIDKSALVRLAESPDAAEWAARIQRGLVRITTVTRLETGYSARSGPEMRAGFQRPPLSSMPAEYLTPAIEDRAVELLTLLADRGQHRAPSIPDLIIAATAELAGLTVLHLDKDFDLIAEITAQPMERLNMDSAAETGSDAEQAGTLSFPDSGRCGRSAGPLPAETFAEADLRHASAVQVTTFGCFTGAAACLPFAGQLLSQLGAPYNPRGRDLSRSVHPGMGTSVLAG